MWGKQLGLIETPKSHYYINNESMCGQFKLTELSYIKYEDTEKCSKCIDILEKIRKNARVII